MTSTDENYINYVLQAGMTRDCQKRRLTESQYVELGSILNVVYRTLSPNAHFNDDLTGADLAVLKLAFTTVFSGGEAYVPLSQWKFVANQTIREYGGKRVMRAADPGFLHELTREDRTRTAGRNLRSAVIARLERGLDNG